MSNTTTTSIDICDGMTFIGHVVERNKGILLAHIEAFLPPRALKIARVAELSERDQILTFANLAQARS
jgi:hypothetical protein